MLGIGQQLFTIAQGIGLTYITENDLLRFRRHIIFGGIGEINGMVGSVDGMCGISGDFARFQRAEILQPIGQRAELRRVEGISALDHPACAPGMGIAAQHDTEKLPAHGLKILAAIEAVVLRMLRIIIAGIPCHGIVQVALQDVRLIVQAESARQRGIHGVPVSPALDGAGRRWYRRALHNRRTADTWRPRAGRFPHR